MANLSPDKEIATESGARKALTPGRRLGLVDETRQVWQVSIRLVCAVIEADRQYHYAANRSLQPGDRGDPWALRVSPEPLAAAARRLADVRQTDLSAYTEEGLQLRHKTPKRRVAPAASKSGRTTAARTWSRRKNE